MYVYHLESMQSSTTKHVPLPERHLEATSKTIGKVIYTSPQNLASVENSYSQTNAANDIPDNQSDSMYAHDPPYPICKSFYSYAVHLTPAGCWPNCLAQC